MAAGYRSLQQVSYAHEYQLPFMLMNMNISRTVVMPICKPTSH